MRVGTKSVLFGAHCFLIHPFFVARAWWILYGFPWDPRLWLAFLVHDIGYWGKSNMDGPEGEQHPYRGAFIMGALFGQRWYEFTLYHSRFLAKRNKAHFSRLCVADKLAIAITPYWLNVPLMRLTGEIKEYMADTVVNSNGRLQAQSDPWLWYASVQQYCRSWVNQHHDMRPDTWTENRH